MSEPMQEENQVDRFLRINLKQGIYTNVGYVYILKADNGLYKIGKSKDVNNSVNSLKTSGIELFRVFLSSDMDMTEKMLHAMFSESRELGEWFRMGEEELERLNDREGDHLMTHCYL